MVQSSKPRKQRRFRYNAPLHIRQHFVHAHIDKALGEKLKIKKRAVQISKGDSVKIVKGIKKGVTGKVIRVDLRRSRIYLDSANRKNAKGKEFNIPINVNNVYIIDLNLSDKLRMKKLNISKKAETATKKEKIIESGAKSEEQSIQSKNEFKQQINTAGATNV